MEPITQGGPGTGEEPRAAAPASKEELQCRRSAQHRNCSFGCACCWQGSVGMYRAWEEGEMGFNSLQSCWGGEQGPFMLGLGHICTTGGWR